MKYSSRQYAKALYESLYGRENEQSRNLIKNFADLVVSNGDIGKFNDIVKEFIGIWNEKESIVEVEISSAKKINSKTMEMIKDYLKKKLSVREVDVEEVVDESLLGGAVLKYKDKVFDASVRSRLKSLEAILKS